MFVKSLQDNAGVSMMFGDGFREDQDIVEVHIYDAFSNQVLEDVIHHCLEGGRGIGQSKKHHQWLEKSTIHMKGCLPLITFFHTHIIVSPTNIEFSEILRSSKLIHKV